MTLATPQLEFFAELSVQVAKLHEVGRTARGLRRLIPILGGEAVGDGWGARVLPGGADFQLVVSDTLAELMARLVRGEPVDPALIYFRCSPSFETVSPVLRWINERMFVGTGARHRDNVVMQFFQLA